MRMKHTICIDDQTCVGCGLCKLDCPEGNIKIENRKAVICSQNCLYCGHCEAVCPKGAIRLTGFPDKTEEYREQVRLNPKELLQAIKSRRSIRHFKEQQISPNIIQQIIEAGRFAPTAKNAQNVSFIILDKNRERYERMAVSLFRKVVKLIRPFVPIAAKVEIDDHFFFKKAPIAIVIAAPTPVDGALAAENMAFMAEAYGLGVLFSGFFTIAANHQRKLRKELQLNRKKKAVTTLVLGYPNVHYLRTAQREPANTLYL